MAPGARHRRLPRLERRRRAGGDRRRTRSLPRVVATPRRAARRVLHEGGGRPRGARGADRAGHDRRDGQAAPRGTPRVPARGADPPLLRRRGVAPLRRAVRAVGGRPAALHAPAAARRRRSHHAVELPDRDPGLEARTRADLRQHDRPEARVRGAADGPARRGVLRRGRAAGGSPQRAHRRGLEGRRRDRLQRGRPRDLVHGLRPRRPLRPRRGDRPRLPRAARARRTQPAARDRHAELDRAVEAAYAGAFWSAGQKCTATRRILVEDSVYDAFRETLLARVAAGKVGDPADPRSRGRPGRERGRARGHPRRDRARRATRAARCSPAASAPTTTAT